MYVCYYTCINALCCACVHFFMHVCVCVCPEGLQADRAFPGACQSCRVAFPYWLLSLLSEAKPSLHLTTSVSVSSRAAAGKRHRARSCMFPLSIPIVTCAVSAQDSIRQPSTLILGVFCFILHLLSLKECDVACV